MNFSFRRLLLITLFFLTANLQAAGTLKILVNLSPAGSFEIASNKVKGSASRNGGGFVTKGISVKAKFLKTGLDLRDEHLHKKLEIKKYKKISILQGKASGGKGVAIIEIKGVKKKIAFNYKESGSNLLATFNLSLKDFKFSGINYAGVGVKDKINVVATIPIK
jgi:hypothetical protein